MEDFSREVDVSLTSAYLGDAGVGEYTFTLKKIINGVDITALNPYLKIRFSDETTDKLSITMGEVVGDNVSYVFAVSSAFTRRAGKATCQLAFENTDGTICVHSAKFSVEIYDSVEVDGYNESQVPSAVRQLQTELAEMVNELRSDYDGGKSKFSTNEISPYSGARVSVKVPAVGGMASMQKVATAGSSSGVMGIISIGDGGGEIKVKYTADEEYNSVLQVKNDKISMESKGPVLIKSEGDVSFNCQKAVVGAVKTYVATISQSDWTSNVATLSVQGVRVSDSALVVPTSNGGAFYSFGVCCSGVGENAVFLSCSDVPSEDIAVKIFIFG